MLRDALRRPLEFLADDPPRLGELARLGVLERLGLDAREEERLVDPDREGLDRFTLEPPWAERPPPPRAASRCCPERASWMAGITIEDTWRVNSMNTVSVNAFIRFIARYLCANTKSFTGTTSSSSESGGGTNSGIPPSGTTVAHFRKRAE